MGHIAPILNYQLVDHQIEGIKIVFAFSEIF